MTIFSAFLVVRLKKKICPQVTTGAKGSGWSAGQLVLSTWISSLPCESMCWVFCDCPTEAPNSARLGWKGWARIFHQHLLGLTRWPSRVKQDFPDPESGECRDTSRKNTGSPPTWMSIRIPREMMKTTLIAGCHPQSFCSSRFSMRTKNHALSASPPMTLQLLDPPYPTWEALRNIPILYRPFKLSLLSRFYQFGVYSHVTSETTLCH